MTDRAVLFLDMDMDMDGVLHSASGRQQLLRRPPVLETWLRDRPLVDVVISSTWRKNRSVAQLAEMSSEDLRPRIAGVAPVIDAELWEAPPLYPRQAEVTAWLRKNAPPGGRWSRWAAIDDQHRLYPPFTPQPVTHQGCDCRRDRCRAGAA